jgi:hypothetical protein
LATDASFELMTTTKVQAAFFSGSRSAATCLRLS